MVSFRGIFSPCPACPSAEKRVSTILPPPGHLAVVGILLRFSVFRDCPPRARRPASACVTLRLGSLGERFPGRGEKNQEITLQKHKKRNDCNPVSLVFPGIKLVATFAETEEQVQIKNKNAKPVTFFTSLLFYVTIFMAPVDKQAPER